MVAGEDFRFGVRRSGDLALLSAWGSKVAVVPELPGVSLTAIRTALVAGELKRLPGCWGVLSSSTASSSPATRGEGRSAIRLRTSGFSRISPARRYGIYAGFALGHRAAISIGTNPHYGGSERRIEPYLLDFDGDLYGRRLVVELWERLRDEAVFESEGRHSSRRSRSTWRQRSTHAGRSSIASVDRVAQDNGHPLIQARNLVKRFGDFVAVDGIDFDVERGEAFGSSARTARARRRRCG